MLPVIVNQIWTLEQIMKIVPWLEGDPRSRAGLGEAIAGEDDIGIGCGKTIVESIADIVHPAAPFKEPRNKRRAQLPQTGQLR